MFIHGGFWRARFGAETTGPLAETCARAGWRVWNLEYPRIGMPGGGWPGTASAVADGVNAAIDEAGDRPVVLVGHSAGGHLALWTAGLWAAGLGAAGLGAAGLRAAHERAPSPALVVSLAGVTDLEAAARAGLGQGATLELLGAEPDTDPALYAQASPIRRLPLGTPVVLIHGDADDRVPVQQSRDYTQAAREAGDRCELHVLEGVDHFALIDPEGPAWPIIRARLQELAAT